METPASKPLGRTQKIAIGALAAPFVIASVAMFVGRADFAAWASYVQTTYLTVVVPLLGIGMAGKVMQSRAPAEAKPE